jgi:hypothetical protein
MVSDPSTLSNQYAIMKPLLKLYLALGILAQFAVAGFVDLFGYLSAMSYQDMDMKIPAFTHFFISIRHLAFLWPVLVLLLTAILLYKTGADSILLHLFGSMMLAPIVIMAFALLSIFLPMISGTKALSS